MTFHCIDQNSEATHQGKYTETIKTIIQGPATAYNKQTNRQNNQETTSGTPKIVSNKDKDLQ